MNLVKSKTACFSGKNIGPATLSPSNSEIVFSVSDDADKDSYIYKVRIDGTNVEALTNDTSYAYAPAYAPDGTSIVFSSMPDKKQGNLYLMKPDGTDKKLLTSGSHNDFGAIFSRDGQKVFFIRAEHYGNYSPVTAAAWHDMDIFSINTDGTDLRQITASKYFRIGNLSISPDGRMLFAEIKIYRSPYSIWAIPVDQPTNKRPIRPNFGSYKSKTLFFFKEKINYDELYDPEISPDGRNLLFCWKGGPSYKQIFSMDLETNNAQVLTNMKRTVYSPHFSIDGSKIIFKTIDYADVGFFKTRAEPTLWIMNKDGSELSPIIINRHH